MKLIPFENIEIESALTAAEIENSIKKNIACTTELKMLFEKDSHQKYEGFVENDTFVIRRILKNGFNSFIPTAYGTISEGSNGGTKISINIRLHKLVMIFVLATTLFTALILITMLLSTPDKNEVELEDSYLELGLNEEIAKELASSMTTTKEQSRINWNSLLILVAPYFITLVFYNIESALVKDKIQYIFKA
jgi:hypothetical protein